MDYFTVRPKPKTYDLLESHHIRLINWDGIDVEADQVFHFYDTDRKCRTGLIITGTGAKELVRKSRKRTNFYKGNLYIKAFSKKYGLWELTMNDTLIKQLDEGVIWFKHDGISSYKIIRKNKSSNS